MKDKKTGLLQTTAPSAVGYRIPLVSDHYGGGRTFIAMVSAVQYSLHLHLHKHEMLLFTIPGML